MVVTVKDVMQLDLLKSLKLIGGVGGINNEVTRVGILDSEYTRRGSNLLDASYWAPGEFVISTFLYAVDNHELILRAIKRMHKNKTAGLAIKNVFDLDIEKEIIRYANRNNYPVFLFTDNSIFFDDIIIQINKLIERAHSYTISEKYINQIIYTTADKEIIKNLALEINYSLANFYTVSYLYPRNETASDELYTYLIRGIDKELYDSGNAIVKFRDGIFCISSNKKTAFHKEDALHGEPFPEQNLNCKNFFVGISQDQVFLYNLREALLQSYYAALYCKLQDLPMSRYDSIGIYKLLFLNINNPAAIKDYTYNILQPIIDYDEKSNSNIFETVLCLEQCNGDIKQVSKSLYIHENTIRYRLKKAYEILGFDAGDKSCEIELYIAFKLFRIKESLQIDVELFD